MHWVHPKRTTNSAVTKHYARPSRGQVRIGRLLAVRCVLLFFNALTVYRPREATLVKHVVTRKQKKCGKGYFFHTSSRTAFRIAISCNFGKKGILFSSTSLRLGYEFQRHESSLYSPPFCRLLWHFYTFSHNDSFKPCNSSFMLAIHFERLVSV